MMGNKVSDIGRTPSTTHAWPGFHANQVVSEFLSAEQFASACKRIWSMDNRSPIRVDRSGPPTHATTVYCKRDRLHTLWPALLGQRGRIVLVTSESANVIEQSHEIPDQIACWFGTNSESTKIHALPLGLGNSYCGVTAKATQLSMALRRSKTKLLYVNFRPETNPEVRMPLWQHFTSGNWTAVSTCEPGNTDRDGYVGHLAEHQFVLCPRGRGIDTHRIWEALYVGTIPIVESHPALESFTDLPILFVERLHDIQPDFLARKFEEMTAAQWNWPKLFMPWWKQRFNSELSAIKGKVRVGDFLRVRMESLRQLVLQKFASQ
jgi:hypothetical protein